MVLTIAVQRIPQILKNSPLALFNTRYQIAELGPVQHEHYDVLKSILIKNFSPYDRIQFSMFISNV